jgi:hypothetical protein
MHIFCTLGPATSVRAAGAKRHFRQPGRNTRQCQGSVHGEWEISKLQPDLAFTLSVVLMPSPLLSVNFQQAIRSSSQGTVTPTSLGKDAGKSTFTIKSPTPMMASQVERVESTDCFSKLGLIPELLRGIYAYGYGKQRRQIRRNRSFTFVS